MSAEFLMIGMMKNLRERIDSGDVQSMSDLSDALQEMESNLASRIESIQAGESKAILHSEAMDGSVFTRSGRTR